MEFPIVAYLQSLKHSLLDPDNWRPITLTREWVELAPDEAGVYVLKHMGELVYVGETGNLRGRMQDLLNSRQHSVRRTLGKKLFSDHEGFAPATERVKFPDHIETLLNSHFTTNLSIAYLEVSLGRKELEELIDSELNPLFRLNKRGKRRSIKKRSLKL